MESPISFLHTGTGGTVPSGPFFLRPQCPTRCKSTLSPKFPSAKAGRRGRFQVSHFQTTVPGVPLFALLLSESFRGKHIVIKKGPELFRAAVVGWLLGFCSVQSDIQSDAREDIFVTLKLWPIQNELEAVSVVFIQNGVSDFNSAMPHSSRLAVNLCDRSRSIAFDGDPNGFT